MDFSIHRLDPCIVTLAFADTPSLSDLGGLGEKQFSRKGAKVAKS